MQQQAAFAFRTRGIPVAKTAFRIGASFLRTVRQHPDFFAQKPALFTAIEKEAPFATDLL